MQRRVKAEGNAPEITSSVSQHATLDDQYNNTRTLAREGRVGDCMPKTYLSRDSLTGFCGVLDRIFCCMVFLFSSIRLKTLVQRTVRATNSAFYAHIYNTADLELVSRLQWGRRKSWVTCPVVASYSCAYEINVGNRPFDKCKDWAFQSVNSGLTQIARTAELALWCCAYIWKICRHATQENPDTRYTFNITSRSGEAVVAHYVYSIGWCNIQINMLQIQQDGKP